MTGGRSSRKSDQKGVEAIFSSPKEGKHVRTLLGGVLLLAGMSSIIVSGVMLQFPHLWDRSALALYGSLGFASLGVLLATCGVGIIVTGSQRSNLPRSGSVLGTDVSRSLSTSNGSPNLKFALTVFLQGIILLSLYTGLVEEYQSNPTMQVWVHSSIEGAQYLLNWGALVVSAFIIGILVVYALVSRDLVE